MLNLKEIENAYPENLRKFRRFILREYLQYKILEIVFVSEFSDKLCFMGGTCLRIVHNNNRFSEDLDFDNFELDQKQFDRIAGIVENKLTKEGYQVEIATAHRAAYRCTIKFPKLLYNEGLSGHAEEEILIQLDTETQHFDFKPDSTILNKWDVFTRIFFTPPDLLLSQKIYAILNRPRSKGRDFYDILFLLNKTKPNFDFLKVKVGIKNSDELKQRILDRCRETDMQEMANDVSSFLIKPEEKNNILLFPDFIKQVKFD